MADMKIPGSLPAPVQRPQGGARAEAIRNAQKAFFDAALNQAQAQAPKPQPAAAQARSAQGVAAPAQPPSAEPQRFLRPGSRLDIKV